MPQTVAYAFYEDALPEWDIPYILLAEDDAGDIFFPVRPICEALQLQRSKQNAIIQADSRTQSGVRTIKAPTAGGQQDTLYLRKRECAIWLANIDPARVNGTAKGHLEDFQEDLWQLAEHTVFRRHRVANASVEDTGIVVQLSGELRGEFTCECGRRHVFEIADGVMRVYHR